MPQEYTVMIESLGRDEMFNRWLIFHEDTFKNLTEDEVIRKINDFTHEHPDFKIELTLPGECMYITAEQTLSNGKIIKHHLRLTKKRS